MKLLYVVHQFFPDCFSGTEQYCLSTSREARRRGHDTKVLSLVPDQGHDDPPLLVEDQPYDGMPVLRLRHWWGLAPNDALREYRNPLVAERFRRVLEEERPDVVHFFHLRNLGADLLLVAAELGIRTVVHLMDFWYLCPEFTLRRTDGTLCQGPPDGGLGCVKCHKPELAGTFDGEIAGAAARDFAVAAGRTGFGWSQATRFAALMQRPAYLRSVLSRADAVVAPSRFLRDMFGRNGFDTGKIVVIPYGLEPDRVRRIEVERPRDPLRLAFAGVLSPWKAPHVPIRAVRRLQRDVRLTIHGRLEEGMFADYIASLRAEAGDDPRIHFPGAFVHDQLSEVLAETDLLVVPSTWYENTPFVMLEAFAAGVPVLCSDLGGMTELIEEGRNGFLFPPEDDAALAERIDALCADPDIVRRMRPEVPPGVSIDFDRFEQLYSGSPQGV